MMEILTFCVLYYHIFIFLVLVVVGIDYIFGINLFEDVRLAIDKPVGTVYICIEFFMAIAAVFGYMHGSIAIFSALWAVTIVLIVSLLLALCLYTLQKFLKLE